MKTITGEEIRALRNNSGLSREKFARYIGVSFRTIIRWETGQKKTNKNI
jgi:DNA-binding transcriptional regulator YiaG